MRAPLQQQGGGRTARLIDNGIDLGAGAVLIVAALKHQERRLDGGEQIFDVPGSEPGTGPGFRPGLEHCLALVTVISRKSRRQFSLGKRLPGLLDAIQTDLLDKNVSRERDHAFEQGWPFRAENEADAAAIGMTDEEEGLARDQGFDHPWQFLQGVGMQIVDGSTALKRRRLAVAEPIIEQPWTAGALAQLIGKVLPLINGTQSFVKEEQPRTVRPTVNDLVMKAILTVQFKERHGSCVRKRAAQAGAGRPLSANAPEGEERSPHPFP